MILFSINILFAHSEEVSNIPDSNSFICTHLNGFKYSLAQSAGTVEYTDCTFLYRHLKLS